MRKLLGCGYSSVASTSKLINFLCPTLRLFPIIFNNLASIEKIFEMQNYK
jgi:hypothetical protein